MIQNKYHTINYVIYQYNKPTWRHKCGHYLKKIVNLRVCLVLKLELYFFGSIEGVQPRVYLVRAQALTETLTRSVSAPNSQAAGGANGKAVHCSCLRGLWIRLSPP